MMKKHSLIFSATIALIFQGCTLKNKNAGLSDMTVDLTETVEVNGGYLQIHANAHPNEGLLRGKDLNTIQINASPLDLKFPSTKLGVSDIKTNSSKSYTRYIVSDALYQQTRFGMTKMENQTYIFSQGHPTAKMPEQGKATYRGHAAVHLDKYLGTASAISNVDFAQNTLQVKISTPEQQPQEIIFDAVIRGNTFSGDKTVISSGGFYGKNAAELGGYFIKDTHNYGAFGGRKTP